VEGLYARYDVKIPFLPTESDEALTWLRSKGWSDGEPFVCLLVRDDEYLAHDSLHGNGNPRAYEGWSYHNYRNSDIDTYLPAIGWLAAQGVWVIRMGKFMAKPLPTGMDHVIDYAFDPGKSDLLDIWLFANCTGCIGTATGLDMLPSIYGVPQLIVNALPLGSFLSWGRSIWIPKRLKWAATGQDLSVSEHLANDWSATAQYTTECISIVDLTSEEITAAVQEFWQRCSEAWQGELEDEVRQAEFWEICMAWPEYSSYHGWRHPEALIGSAWLKFMAQTAESSGQCAGDAESIARCS